MDIDGDGMFVLIVIPMAVVYTFLFSFMVTLAVAKRHSKPAGALLKIWLSIAFLAAFFCLSPFIAIPLFSPVYMLFLTLPMKGLISSWGPAKYLLGAAPFAAVSLGVYFFLGARAGIAKKTLMPGAVFSLLVLLGPMMFLYAKVEYLSAKHFNKLKQVEISNFYDIAKEEIVFMKVFEYGDYEAKTFAVVCVPPGRDGPVCDASYYFYERDGIVDKWKFRTYQPLWGGNRDDDLPWPPY